MAEDLEEGEISSDGEVENQQTLSKTNPCNAPYTKQRTSAAFLIKDIPNPNSFRDNRYTRDDLTSDEEPSEDSDAEVMSKKRKLSSLSTQAQNQEAKKMKKLHVWSNVLLEEQITDCIKATGNLSDKEADASSRGVETYSYTESTSKIRPLETDSDYNANPTSQTEEDELWDVTQDGESHNNSVRSRVGRKNGVKQRLGQRGSKHKEDSKQRDRHVVDVPRHVTTEDDERTVAHHIASCLKEPKLVLMERVVRFLGKEKAIDLYNKTEQVEAVGGMKTHDGKSRRTPGGVFIQLMKTDPGISKETVKDIFALEKEIQKNIKRDNMREMRKRKYGGNRKPKKSNDVCQTKNNSELHEEQDEFDLMEEPDIEIGVA